MKNIRAQFKLSEHAIAVDRRYVVTVGDGVHSSRFVLGPHDQFDRPEWEFLVGPSTVSGEWRSDRDEGMYVHIYRQYVNPEFDFSIEGYKREQWLWDLPEVSCFRLYNPLFARPCLNWPDPKTNGWASGQPFSEGDQHSYAWDFTLQDYESREIRSVEKDVQYRVKRLADTDFKEFLITLD